MDHLSTLNKLQHSLHRQLREMFAIMAFIVVFSIMSYYNLGMGDYPLKEYARPLFTCGILYVLYLWLYVTSNILRTIRKNNLLIIEIMNQQKAD